MHYLQDKSKESSSPYGHSVPSKTPPKEAATPALTTPISLHFTNLGKMQLLLLRDHISFHTATSLAKLITLCTDAPLVEVRRGSQLLDTRYRMSP